jgi:hypothetical protein
LPLRTDFFLPLLKERGSSSGSCFTGIKKADRIFFSSPGPPYHPLHPPLSCVIQEAGDEEAQGKKYITSMKFAAKSGYETTGTRSDAFLCRQREYERDTGRQERRELVEMGVWESILSHGNHAVWKKKKKRDSIIIAIFAWCDVMSSDGQRRENAVYMEDEGKRLVKARDISIQEEFLLSFPYP